MKTINVTTVLEKANTDNLSNIIACLPTDTILYIMGIVDIPDVAQKVHIDEYNTTGVVEKINYLEGTVRVAYNRPWVRWYKKDSNDWHFKENAERGFVIRKEGTDETKEWFHLDEITF